MICKPRHVLCILATVLGQTASASNLVSNGSFEDYNGTFGADNGASLFSLTPTLPGWYVVGSGFSSDVALFKAPNAYGLTASDGQNLIDLSGYSDSNYPKGLATSIGTFNAGSSYSLTFDIGVHNGSCGPLSNCGGPIGVNVAIDSINQSFSFNSAVSGSAWRNFQINFVASSTRMVLQFSGTSGNNFIGLDNVSISAVPEVGEFRLFIAGISLLLALRSGTIYSHNEAA